MKQFGKILKFELKNYFTNKVFVGVTIFLMVVIVAVMFFPAIRDSLGGTGEDAPMEAGDRPVMLLAAEDEAALAALAGLIAYLNEEEER